MVSQIIPLYRSPSPILRRSLESLLDGGYASPGEVLSVSFIVLPCGGSDLGRRSQPGSSLLF